MKKFSFTAIVSALALGAALGLPASGCGGGAKYPPAAAQLVPAAAEMFVIFAPYCSVEEFTGAGLGENTAQVLQKYSDSREDYHMASVDGAGNILSVQVLAMRPAGAPGAAPVIVFRKP